MAIGERDWESEFFVGFAPTRQSIINGMSRIDEDVELTEVNRAILLRLYEKHLKAIEQITYDPIGGKFETPAAILKKLLQS